MTHPARAVSRFASIWSGPAATGKEAAEIAAHSTRDRKEIHSPGEVMAAHRKLAADFGHQADAVVRAARERPAASGKARQLRWTECGNR